ncbi:MAG TPA: UDP-N-acetylmuramate--L-alanine ligase [Candidatus Omnitrophota bacterium]|nr:UDP-N-acetylmuramate--L-alanine ligase [Candidatus Omnitrophota bacterium]
MTRIVSDDLVKDCREAYLIGIGGSGMSGLARILKHLGLSGGGSDYKESCVTRNLRHDGIRVSIGQKDIGLGGADLVIYSSAIRPDHLELAEARKSGRKVYHRAEVLASLMNHADTAIAVLGTHGKTTTSAMTSFVLSRIGAEPTCFVGSDMINFGTNIVAGGRKFWVSEVDESDSSHEFYAPHYAIIANLEPEHLDHYQSWENLQNSFRRFLAQIHHPGLVTYFGNDPVLSQLVRESGKPSASFGFTEDCDFAAQNVKPLPFGTEFDLHEAGFFSRKVTLSVPGRHNVANALAVIGLLSQMGFELDSICGALREFKGTKRRMEVKWQSSQFIVLDDYAHHPTEVKAVLKALRETGKYVRVIFQPHRFSRTYLFYRDFAHAFDDAHEVLLTDIYAAGEPNPHGVSVELIANEVASAGHPNVRIVHRDRVIPYLSEHPLADGVMVFMGAGDIGDLANDFVGNMNAHPSA